MHKPNSKSNSSNESKHNNNVTSKLRRLKIEENLLLQSLKKLDQKQEFEVSESDTSNDVDCESTIRTVKDSYIKIKTLFDDIKIVTSSRELLAELEIEEIKQRVLEFETKMKSFKFYLNSELSTLKNAEQELIKQIEDLHCEEANVKKRAKISTSTFKQAVPSPVRLLMTSPLKCSEVQEFQDFMKNSPNRYGGWNEYHHNIFVKLWQKHFGNSADIGDTDTFGNLALNNFIEESSLKLQGIDKKNFMSHIQWYKTYLLLKSKQQIAIDKWKSNKRSTRKILKDNEVQHILQNGIENIPQPKYVEKIKKLELSKPTPKKLSKEDIERIMAPTKQWLSRYVDEPKQEQIISVENLNKLGIPNWRQHL